MIKELRPEECQTLIYGGRGFNHQCSNKSVVTREGKLYCRIHDPEYIAEKKRKWQEAFDKERIEQSAMWDLKQARNDATEGLTLQELRQVTPELIKQKILGDYIKEG